MSADARNENDRRPIAVLLGVLVGVVVLCVAVMRNTIVAYDDWNFVLDRRGGSPSLLPNALDQWIQPHNGHPVMVLVAFYRAAGRLLSYNYPGMIGFAALVHAVLVATIYVYARRRVGPWGALVPAVLVALIGRGAYVVLSPIAMAFTLALLAGVLALNIIDSPGPRRPAIVGLLGLFALGSSGLGVARVVTIAADRLPRSRTWRSFVVWSVATATPMMMLAIWYVNVRRDDRSSKDFGGGITFALRLLGNGAVALFGIGDDRTGPAAALLALVLGAVLLVRRRAVDWYRVGALALGLAVDLGLVTWARSGNTLPSTGRYLYVVGVQVALIGTESLRGWRPSIGRVRRLAAVTSIAVVVGAVIAGSDSFRTVARDFTRDNRLTQVVFASFLRAQTNGVTFDDSFQPESHYAPQVSAARFNGLLADGRNPLRGAGPTPRTEQEKQAADYFAGLERIRLLPADRRQTGAAASFDYSASAPVEVDSSNVLSETKGRCTTMRSIGVGAFVDLQVPIAGDTWLVSSTGSTLVQTRKLAEGFSGRNAATVTARRDALITVDDGSGERARRPWVIRIEPTPDARVCTGDAE